MKLTNFVVAASFASQLAIASVVIKSVRPRVVGIDLHRNNPVDVLRHERDRLKKKSDTLEVTLDNEETLYFAQVSLGTPSQSLKLHIDTGSSDLWVNTANSSLCSRRNQCDGGTFDPTSSSTLTVGNTDFNISYADGSGASGDYVTDTLTVGDIILTDFQFGLGEISKSTEGVLGIGYVSNEVQVQVAGLNSYPNLPQALKNAGNIARNAYSLWLNDQESNTGTILFGGVNTAKYEGTLATLPIIPQSGGYADLMIALTAISVDGTSITSSSLPAAALLDSGTTLTYLPSDITRTIYNQVGATYDERAGYAYVDCSLANTDGTLTYSFSGKSIAVAYEELVIDEGSSGRGSETCIFGIAPNDGLSILGDTFLRSAYVVYDLENNEISLAQTVFNATDDSIEEIPSGTSLPPGATSVSNAVTSVEGGTSGSSSYDTNAISAGSKTMSPTLGIVSAMVAMVYVLIL